MSSRRDKIERARRLFGHEPSVDRSSTPVRSSQVSSSSSLTRRPSSSVSTEGKQQQMALKSISLRSEFLEWESLHQSLLDASNSRSNKRARLCFQLLAEAAAEHETNKISLCHFLLSPGVASLIMRTLKTFPENMTTWIAAVNNLREERTFSILFFTAPASFAIWSQFPHRTDLLEQYFHLVKTHYHARETFIANDGLNAFAAQCRNLAPMNSTFGAVEVSYGTFTHQSQSDSDSVSTDSSNGRRSRRRRRSSVRTAHNELIDTILLYTGILMSLDKEARNAANPADFKGAIIALLQLMTRMETTAVSFLQRGATLDPMFDVKLCEFLKEITAACQNEEISSDDCIPVFEGLARLSVMCLTSPSVTPHCLSTLRLVKVPLNTLQESVGLANLLEQMDTIILDASCSTFLLHALCTWLGQGFISIPSIHVAVNAINRTHGTNETELTFATHLLLATIRHDGVQEGPLLKLTSKSAQHTFGTHLHLNGHPMVRASLVALIHQVTMIGGSIQMAKHFKPCRQRIAEGYITQDQLEAVCGQLPDEDVERTIMEFNMATIQQLEKVEREEDGARDTVGEAQASERRILLQQQSAAKDAIEKDPQYQKLQQLRTEARLDAQEKVNGNIHYVSSRVAAFRTRCAAEIKDVHENAERKRDKVRHQFERRSSLFAMDHGESEAIAQQREEALHEIDQGIELGETDANALCSWRVALCGEVVRALSGYFGTPPPALELEKEEEYVRGYGFVGSLTWGEKNRDSIVLEEQREREAVIRKFMSVNQQLGMLKSTRHVVDEFNVSRLILNSEEARSRIILAWEVFCAEVTARLVSTEQDCALVSFINVGSLDNSLLSPPPESRSPAFSQSLDAQFGASLSVNFTMQRSTRSIDALLQSFNRGSISSSSRPSTAAAQGDDPAPPSPLDVLSFNSSSGEHSPAGLMSPPPAAVLQLLSTLSVNGNSLSVDIPQPVPNLLAFSGVFSDTEEELTPTNSRPFNNRLTIDRAQLIDAVAGEKRKGITALEHSKRMSLFVAFAAETLATISAHGVRLLGELHHIAEDTFKTQDSDSSEMESSSVSTVEEDKARCTSMQANVGDHPISPVGSSSISSNSQGMTTSRSSGALLGGSLSISENGHPVITFFKRHLQEVSELDVEQQETLRRKKLFDRWLRWVDWMRGYMCTLWDYPGLDHCVGSEAAQRRMILSEERQAVSTFATLLARQTTRMWPIASLMESERQSRGFIKAKEEIRWYQMCELHRPAGKRYRPPRPQRPVKEEIPLTGKDRRAIGEWIQQMPAPHLLTASPYPEEDEATTDDSDSDSEGCNDFISITRVTPDVILSSASQSQATGSAQLASLMDIQLPSFSDSKTSVASALRLRDTIQKAKERKPLALVSTAEAAARTRLMIENTRVRQVMRRLLLEEAQRLEPLEVAVEIIWPV